MEEWGCGCRTTREGGAYFATLSFNDLNMIRQLTILIFAKSNFSARRTQRAHAARLCSAARWLPPYTSWCAPIRSFD